jgi:hypothetical protein
MFVCFGELQFDLFEKSQDGIVKHELRAFYSMDLRIMAFYSSNDPRALQQKSRKTLWIMEGLLSHSSEAKDISVLETLLESANHTQLQRIAPQVRGRQTRPPQTN